MALTPSPDQYAANVSLLLPFDEDLTDYSASPKTVTAFGNAAVSATQKKYGAKSLALDGTGDYLGIPHSSSLDLTSGDFTLETWIRLDSTGSIQGIFSTRSSGAGGAVLRVQSTGKIIFFITGQATADTESTSILSTGAWYHVAIARSGSSIRIFVNGTLEKTTTSSATGTAGTSVAIGSADAVVPGLFLGGYLDEIRITKGVSRYTGDFTPPNSFFTIIADINSTTPVPLSVFEATYVPNIYADINSTTPIPSSVVEAYHVPFAAAFSSTTPVPISNVVAVHDWGAVVSARPDYFTIYRCFLDDLEIPLKGWQATLSQSELNSYVSITTPGMALSSEIAARSTGTLTIKKGYRNGTTGEEQLETLFTVSLTGINSDEGGNSQTISLEGLAPISFDSAKTRAISGVSYRRVSSTGKVALRAPVDYLLRPGDTVTYSVDSFVVGKLTIWVSPTGESMEVSEE